MMLAGCGRDASRDGVVTLRIASWGNEVESAKLRDLVAEFEADHPNIRVELQITPWTRMLDKLMISTAGGRPPDVTRISSTWFAPIAAKGLLEPLEGYVSRDKFDLDDFYPQAVQGWGKYRGKLYCIPTDIDVYAMYYNKKLFDSAHIPYPDWNWDWAKYVQVAQKLTRDTNGDGQIDIFGCTTDLWWQSYIYSNGGDIISADGTKCVLDKPAAYNGLQFMSDLVNKYRVAPGANDMANIGASKLFTTGKIGMYISGSWAAELIFKNEIKDFTYDVAPMPKGPKARVTFIGGAAYGVLSRSNHKREAWELVKWMTGREYQRRMAMGSQIIPARRSVAESGAYLKLQAAPKSRKIFLEMIKYGRTGPMVACSPEMNSIIASELDLVRLGKKPAKDACETLSPIIDSLLRNSR